jgi:signal transduction histidine kinase
MNRVLSALRAFLDSLTGRMVMILTGGIAAASIASLLVADQARVRDYERARLEAVVASAADMFMRFARDPVRTTDLLHKNIIFGVQEASPDVPEVRPDPQLRLLLIARLGAASRPAAALLPRSACFPNIDLAIRVAGIDEQTLPDCWFVRFDDAAGVERRLSMDIAALKLPPNSTLDPLYPITIIGASALLAFLVAGFATAPLRQLTRAARSFSVTIDPEPIPEHGPSEVRAALQTFNIMQHRVRDGFRERTQFLASIAHDLQTPLTRLRLRLEHVHDETIRDRLIADLAVMQQLVRDNLDLARSVESREPWSVVDIDSILSSLAEDAAEFGAQVRFTQGCGGHARIKPNALVRCLNNLIDNAVKYAGDAELSCRMDGRGVVIEVRDHGTGIQEQVLLEASQPFSRLEKGPRNPAGGTGIGLAIARAQAQTFGANLILQNHAEGGLLATVRLQAD